MGTMSACNNANQTVVAGQQAKVKAGVQQLADSIAADITRDGPIAWLKYFEDSPEFFMASDGQLVFADHQTADKFITGTLIKNISKINLNWNSMRIDALSPEFAQIASGFHEDLTDSKGKITSFDGYFTAIAQQTPKGWMLRNAHWSIKH